MDPIKTFVILDCETTGLPYNGRKMRLTELSLISVSRKSILECRKPSYIPRVKNKLSFVVNPRTLIPDEVVDLTSLSNEALEAEEPFNEERASLIKKFLENCKPPICLVAHNGFKFDFPLLKEELKNFDRIIPDTTLCSDTLLGFKEMSNRGEQGGFNYILSPTDIRLFEEAEKIENEEYCKEQTLLAECLRIEEQYEPTLTQLVNETTPMASIMQSTPTTSNNTTLKVNGVKRRLFDDELPRKKLKLSFSLNDVYSSLFNENIKNAHEAENDVIALLKCCVKLGEPILKYFDSNAILFRDIKPFY